MDKRKLVQEIQRELALELERLLEASRSAHEAATHEESRAEDAHDTRGIEASYLAGAHAERAAEIKRLLTIYKFLPIREYGKQDVVEPGALVELELNQRRAHYFLVPQGGGFITRVDGEPVQVVTPQSPIGDALLGRHVGDVVEIDTRTGTREYKLVGIR